MLGNSSCKASNRDRIIIIVMAPRLRDIMSLLLTWAMYMKFGRLFTDIETAVWKESSAFACLFHLSWKLNDWTIFMWSFCPHCFIVYEVDTKTLWLFILDGLFLRAEVLTMGRLWEHACGSTRWNDVQMELSSFIVYQDTQVACMLALGLISWCIWPSWHFINIKIKALALSLQVLQ